MCYNFNMNLFDFRTSQNTKPLAERMRPMRLEDFVGQKHIVTQGSLLYRAIKADKLGSCIFYGPPGTGKTTLAHIIASSTDAEFSRLNAVSSGVADAKKVIESAKIAAEMYDKKTYLFLDECHRWSKSQSDCVLSAIEDGSIVFIGSTTENPYVSMTKAIVSRCRVFEFVALKNEEIAEALNRAVSTDQVLVGMSVVLTDEACSHFVWASNGDLRTAYNALELAAVTTQPNAEGNIVITKDIAEQSIQKKALSIDDSMYYDMLSAFCKSLRGSDASAALYWSTRLIEAGCDPMLIFRRLIAHSSEDVGMADSHALVVATSAMIAYQNMGAPEGLIPLNHAIIYVCCAPKSNSVVVSMAKAKDAVLQTKDDNVPHYLRDRSYPHPIDDGSSYKYVHDYGGWVEQQYLPDSIKDVKIFDPVDHGEEAHAFDWIKSKMHQK